MNDTQWPRWEVFKKDTPRKPFQAVGSIHAADVEHALLNARNVFVRRPQAVSLWVARVDDIYSRTAEELSRESAGDVGEGEDPVVEAYEIFCKSTHRRSMTFMDHLGQIEAESPRAALQQAVTQFAQVEGLAWWVIPTRAIGASGDDPELVAAWFAPAKDKTYKQQSAYGFVSATRRGRHDRASEEPGTEPKPSATQK